VFGSVLGLCRNFGGCCVVALVNRSTSTAMHLLLFVLTIS
jgi:hypothetical protein